MGHTSRGQRRRRHRRGERSTRSTISLALAAATLALLATTIALPVAPGTSSGSSVAFAADAQLPQTSATASVSFSTQNQGMWGPGSEFTASKEAYQLLVDELFALRPDVDGAPLFEFAADFVAWLQLGLYGEYSVEGGAVDVTYPSQATALALRADGAGYAGVKANETFVIRTSELPDMPTMTSDFAEVSAAAGLYGAIGANSNVYFSLFTECVICNKGFDFGTTFRQEVLGVGVGDGALSIRAFGQPIPGVTGDVDLRPLLPKKIKPYFSDLKLHVPSLDTGAGSSRFDGEVITNTLLPVRRPNTDPTDIDFFVLGADVDAIIGGIASLGQWKSGLSTTVVPGLVEAELAGIDLTSFWGVGQTLQFDANMHAILTLSKPALVEIYPGTNRFEVTQRLSVPVGSDIQVVHPGGDFTVDVSYSLAGTNRFFNDTDIRADLALFSRLLCLNFKGALADEVGSPGCVYEDSIDLGTLTVANLTRYCPTCRVRNWALDGFVDQPGGQLVLPSTDPPRLGVSVAMNNSTRTATLSGSIVDPNAGETFDIDLYWDTSDPAGSSQPLRFGSTPIDSGGVKWTPSTGLFSIEHTYPRGTANDTYELTMEVSDSTAQSSGTVRMTTTFVDPAPRFELFRGLIYPNLTVAPDGHRDIRQTGYINDGNLGDSFTLEIDWGDPSSPGNTQVIQLGADPIGDTTTDVYWDPWNDSNSGTVQSKRYFEVAHHYDGDGISEVFVPTFVVRDSYGQSASAQNAVVFAQPRYPDLTAPTATITSPADGDEVALDEVIIADFECADERYGSGIDSCVGSVAEAEAIDTATVGTKTFTVTATDGSNARLGGGRTTAVTHTYTVVDEPVAAVNDIFEAEIGASISYDVGANDVNVPAGSRYSLTGEDNVSGTPTINASTGRISYTPAPGEYGLLDIGYTVCPPVAAADGSNCGTGEVTLTVEYPEGAEVADAVTVDPARLLDTRGNGESIDGRFVAAGKLGAGQITRVKVAGRGGVPADASGVELNLTAIGADRKGFATLYPCTSPPPTASTLNFYQGVNIANASTVALNAAGEVCIFTSSPAHFALDVVAFFPAGSQVSTVDPARLLDTRGNGESIDGRFVAAGKLGAGQITRVKVAGRGGVPADASGVELNLTAIGADRKGFATLYPCTSPPPTASTLNFYQGVNIANASTVALNAAGEVCIFTSSPAHFALDVVAFFPAGSQVSTVDPARLLDTRGNGESIDGRFVAAGKLGAGQITRVKVAGRGGVPADASGVELNLTAIGADRKGFATLYPCTSPPPTASTLNFYQGVNIANASTVALNAAGEVCIFTSSPAHFALDVVGFVAGGA